MSDVRTLLKKRPLLFDGGMGTYYKGAPVRECEQANRLDPEGIRAVHRAYLAAGADAIKTNTFGLPRMAADDAVRFLTDQLGYGKYLDKNGMDRAKLAVLEMLGAQEPTPRRLLRPGRTPPCLPTLAPPRTPRACRRPRCTRRWCGGLPPWGQRTTCSRP